MMIVSLNNFNKEGWPILHWLRKYLQQVTVFIEINQDFVFLKTEQLKIVRLDNNVFLNENLSSF